MNNSNSLEQKKCVTSGDVTGAPFINTKKRMYPTLLSRGAWFQV
jgi:hypothetical protein